MSNNILNLLSEETYAEKMDKQNALLATIASQVGGIKCETWADVKKVCDMGLANKILTVGDQMQCARGADTLTWDVVDTKPNEITLLLHKAYYPCSLYPAQALYYAETALSAGTYNFIYTGTSRAQFTLAQNVPIGGQIVLTWAQDADITAAKISTFASRTTTTAIESNIAVTVGTGGTQLATINNINRARGGSNNYENSAIRQLLNSIEASATWTPKTIYDRPPTWASSVAGFMYGMDAEFLSVVAKSSYASAKSTIDGGGTATLSDYFYLPSETEVYGPVTSGLTAVEGTAWAYYAKMASTATVGVLTGRIKYLTSATNWYLRSPYLSVGGEQTSRFVTTTGSITGSYALGSLGIVPACKIIGG